MTDTLAEQVASLTVGDWVEAIAETAKSRITANGELCRNALDELYIAPNFYVQYPSGEMNEYLTSITRVPRPIPSEPEVGSFALLVGGDIAWRLETDSAANWDSKSGNCGDWESIYPHIIKLYTPSGELVTGFEYAGGSE